MEWNGMDEGKKEGIRRQGHREYVTWYFLVTDIYDAMKRSNGSSTWRELEFKIILVVSHNCIRRHIQSILDFTYQASRIYPMLDSHVEVGRLQWVYCFWVFWVFWKISKAMATNKQIMLVHMDEE